MGHHGWGRYPVIKASVNYPRSDFECVDEIGKHNSLIVRGLGRSYGDSSLSSNIIETRYLDHFISFDEKTGKLTCESGVSLANIVEQFLPRGWFLPVTPGTKYVSIGGAIASDVHGKNHHISGTLSQYVTEIELLLGNGERVFTSPTRLPELFYATCGGMGLTGFILSATLSLIPVKSNKMICKNIKMSSLEAVLESFEQYADAAYSVAWIDCLAQGKNLGRSILIPGEHAEDNSWHASPGKYPSVPDFIPSFILNKTTMKAFNGLYYSLSNRKPLIETTLESFFYPLDKIGHWNRLYGKSGIIQYQFVLPSSSGPIGLRKILESVSSSGLGFFLAVLKKFGKNNNNLLSFPIEGFTLALDFKFSLNALELLNELDKLVLNYGGRLYLAKDARMSESTFKESYPRWQEFEEIRAKYHATGKFLSAQSRRLGLS